MTRTANEAVPAAVTGSIALDPTVGGGPGPSKGPTRLALGLAGSLALAFVGAAIGAMATRSAPAFYTQLDTPIWAPPPWLFGPVWTVLYIMMAIAAWLVWKRSAWDAAKPALTLYVVQLALNALWSWLFFAWHRGAWALVEIILLECAIVATMVAFSRVRAATLLLVPYVAWVLFATALTASLWLRNPTLLG